METDNIKTCKVNELAGMVGMPVPRLVARLKNIYPIKEGAKNGRKWTLQNGLLEDSTGSIKCTFWNRDMSEAKGCEIVIRSKKKQDGTYSCVTVKQDGQYPPQLHIDRDALVMPKDEENDVQPISSSGAAKETVKQNVSSPAVAVCSLMDLARLYQDCRNTAKAIGIPDGDLSSATATLFIEARRCGIKPSPTKTEDHEDYGPEPTEEF